MQESRSLDDFKERLPLGEIVARFTRLQRRGRELVGLCPFHKEKTPSFTVAPDKGFYHCFGCGAHGNAIDFVMAIEGLDFAAALERLEALTGIAAPRRAAAPVDKGLYEACAAAARWFEAQLQGPRGEPARDYLAGRGLDAGACARFGIGWAPAGREGLVRALGGEGYAPDRLAEAGLVIRPEDGGSPYDRFRDRIMFPIHDRQGRVVAFGGRAMGDGQPKYLNSPDSPLFHKRELLYGLAWAQRAARTAGTLVVAEGYMDVIALVRAGFEHAVAPLGTAISEEQLELLWRLAEEPVICLDGDEAGLRAAHRLAERALERLRAGRSLRFALLPAGEDPDSLLRSRGRGALAERLEAAVPLLDLLWVQETAGRSLATPERQAALRRRLRELARRIPDRDLARLYDEALQRRFFERFGRRRGTGRAPIAATTGRRTAPSRPVATREQRLLGTLVARPELLPLVEEELGALELADEALDRLRQELVEWAMCGQSLDHERLESQLCFRGHGELVEKMRGDPMSGGRQVRHLPLAELATAWRRDCAFYMAALARRREADEAAALVVAEDDDLPLKRRRLAHFVRQVTDAGDAKDDSIDGQPEHRAELAGLEAAQARLIRLGTGATGAPAGDRDEPGCAEPPDPGDPDPDDGDDARR